MHMLQALAFTEARHGFTLQPVYINTRANHLADDLSRGNFSFISKVPEACRQLDPPSQSLLANLLDPTLDWVSNHWRRRFSDIFRRV